MAPHVRKTLYDPGASGSLVPGGTTTLVVDPVTLRVESESLSLAGTLNNCSGGPTPWGSWLTCEEDVSLPGNGRSKLHGFVFEVSAGASTGGLVTPVPLEAMGRFRHEAASVDPKTGVVYLTEDREDGLFYRFLPHTRGELARGGRLQALVLLDRPRADTRNWRLSRMRVLERKPMAAKWIDIEDPRTPGGDHLRHQGQDAGAAVFARGEGMAMTPEGLFFACTSGGAAGCGQIWKYEPSPHEGRQEEAKAPATLSLFVESAGRHELDMCDNLEPAPWGDLIVCEDGWATQHVLAVTPRGTLHKIARNAEDSGEFCGATFSPDGSILFVNVQSTGKTFAIRGPWPGRPQPAP